MIDFKHPQYIKNIGKWDLVNDICDADNLKKYLVQLNPRDVSVENVERNSQFFKRSVFAAVAGYTSRGFVGKAFAKAPMLSVPDEIEYIKKDINGAGSSIYQQSQEVMRDVIRIGRCGLLVDFPTTEGEVSRADIISKNIFATVTRFDARAIINWQTKRVGSKVMPTLVVLTSTVSEPKEDGYEFETKDIWIELAIEEGLYVQREWRLDNHNEFYVHNETVPRDGAGKPLDYIPFVFIGSETNTTTVNHPPMYDLAKINLGHYNNSAIYEDSVFTVGQVQPWMSGLNQETIDLMQSNNMYIGSGRLIGVPSGEKFGFEQAGPNMLAREAMMDKVEMMIGLGAMFMKTGGAAMTATQISGELMAQHSVLSLIAHNVSEAYDIALEMAGQFMDVSGEPEYDYDINQDFIDPEADAQMLNAVVASFLQGVLPISDLFAWQKKHGLISAEKELEDYQEEIGTQGGMIDLEAE
tara:strand:+ start:30 stop:1433 length:1404 start_codon:yes stop_codon:yes gene_type:complete